jgi:hypothetical protein
MDFNATAHDAVIVAWVTPPAISAPLPNWLSKGVTYPLTYQDYVEHIKNNSEPVEYLERGALGIPRVKHHVYLEHKTGGQGVKLAEGACYDLDLVAKVAGAWGPDCVIEKFTKLPKHGLPKVKGSDNLYLYTPTQARTEEARFILGNGAGRKCEVIVIFHKPRHGREDGDASDFITPETEFALADVASDANAWS